MKKTLFLLLCTVQIYGQTSTGQEQEFDYGIKNNSTQTITTPPYLTTTGMDGTQGKIPSALIAKTSDIADSLATKENIANKSDSYTTSSSTTYASTKALVDGLATKQNTLTNPITGTGTTNTIPKFTASGTVGNSSIQDSGSLVSVNSLSEFKGTTASDGGQLGTELTTTATGTNWTGTGFVTGYTHTTGDVTPIVSTLAAVTNNLYQITYTVTGRTTGSITINFGGIAIGGITASGNSGPKAISTATLNIVPTTDFNGTVVLSIKAISASVATTTFKNSSGAVTNEIRAHSSSSNISIGLNAGRSITTGSNNNVVGTSALQTNTTGSNNNVVGTSALQNNTTGSNNNAVGWKALASNTAGYNNSAVGTFSLQTNTTGSNNNAVGTSALQNNTTGSNNNAVGQLALVSNTTGNANNAVGQNALLNNTTGSNNNAVGQLALASNTTGNANNAVGWLALQTNTTGSNNSAIGDISGRYIADKSTSATILNNSIMLGYRTSPLADNQTNQVVIGYDATGLGSNTTVIGNSSTTTARVYGRQLVNTSTDNGTDQLQVNGTISATGGTLSTAPTTSAGTYDILTRNTSTGVVEKVAALGFTPENVANKATTFGTVNNTLYPTVQAVKNEIINSKNYVSVKDYGATGNGSTDDTASINSALTACQSVKGTLYFPSGNYLTTGNFIINSKISIKGEGEPLNIITDPLPAVFNAGSVNIISSSTTNNLFVVNVDGVSFENLTLSCSAGTTTGVGVLFNKGNIMRMNNVGVRSFNINVDVINGASWNISNCDFYNPIINNIRINNQLLPDGGDQAITNCNFFTGPRIDITHMLYKSGGGLKITACKFNQGGSTGAFAKECIKMVNDIGETVDLLISNSSFENYTDRAINLSPTFGFQYVVINGNQFWGNPSLATDGILINSSNINNVVISNNVIDASVNGINYNLGYRITVLGNSFGTSITNKYVNTSSFHPNFLPSKTVIGDLEASYNFNVYGNNSKIVNASGVISAVLSKDTAQQGLFFSLKGGATTSDRYAEVSSYENGFGSLPLVLQGIGGNTLIGGYIDDGVNELQVTGSGKFTSTVTATSFVASAGTIRLKNYTVATLPTGTQGDTAYVTDALAPTYLTVVVGGGSVVCPVFYNGSAWVSH